VLAEVIAVNFLGGLGPRLKYTSEFCSCTCFAYNFDFMRRLRSDDYELETAREGSEEVLPEPDGL